VSPLVISIAAAVVTAALLVSMPRLLLRRAQDRLAARLLAEPGAGFKLLTRAERVAGEHRRVPGILGLTEEAVSFQGLFGETELLPTSRIQKIATGHKLASGRRLLRQEVLRFTRSSGDELEFVLAPASAGAWRSHLGLWAVAERKAAIDRVTPGR
jgi:hypothetical protein